MIPGPIENVDRSALQVLIDHEVPEGKTIEYKVDFPGKAQSDRVPLLATVASLANTAGGDFLLGVEEKKGIPVGLPGIAIDNLDEAKGQLENMLRNGLAPRLPAIRIHPVETDQGRYVLVIRVPPSWMAPHRVEENHKFYARHSVGRYPLDVDELRTAFAMSERLGDRIRDFRAERIGRMMADRAPVPLRQGALMVLHVIPRSAFAAGVAIDVVRLDSAENLVLPIGSGANILQPNLDGFITADTGGVARAYTQIFRNGAMESVCVLPSLQGSPSLGSIWYEKELMKLMENYLELARNLHVSPPYFVILSFIYANGIILNVSPERGGALTLTEREDSLMVPEIMIEDQNAKPECALRPLFDRVWNAFGQLRSFNYDGEGNWSE